jgi:phytanoyl-CoA hydroxylase
MELTAEEFFVFQHNGYLLIPEALTPEVGEQLKNTIAYHAAQRIAPIVCEDPSKPGYGVSRDVPDSQVLRLSKVMARDPIFAQAASTPRLLAALQGLLGPNIEVVLNRHNHVTLRPPGAAQLEWHRDVANWSRPIISAIFYLQDANVENGCTWILPGSQHMLAHHAKLDGHGRSESLDRLQHQALPVPARALDVLLINGLVLHGAGPNLSDASRMSMTLGYHAADELGLSQEPHKYLVTGERVLRHN